MAKILVAYYYRRPFPPRASVRDHLNSFKKYAGHPCYYYNLGIAAVPAWLGRIDFDLIVFHTTFLCCRWNPARFERLLRKAQPLKHCTASKIALPQDEFVYSDLLCDFIREFDIDQVFSPAPPSEWPRIYDRVDRDRVRFFPVLTGYLEDATLDRIDQLATAEAESPAADRPIDIGYRATEARPWLGRHSLLKSTIARVFQHRAPAAGLTTDISTEATDTLLGDEWYRFLLRCKYTIGVEGGASLLDRDGSVRQRTEHYMAKHPTARFDEIETTCFPGLDGNLDLKAISPRHLEACATRTCQILIEGDYNGVLEAGRHYIALKPDFSNLDEVLATVRRDDRREAITNQAYEDIVASGRYSYRRFVATVLEHALPQTASGSPPHSGRAWRDRLLHVGMSFWDRCGWILVAMVSMMLALLAHAKQRLRTRPNTWRAGSCFETIDNQKRNVTDWPASQRVSEVAIRKNSSAESREPNRAAGLSLTQSDPAQPDGALAGGNACQGLPSEIPSVRGRVAADRASIERRSA